MIARTLAALALAAAAALASPSPSLALGDDDYVGSIELVGFPYCPEGTVDLWGQAWPAAQASILNYLLGNRFGGDAAQKTFGFPDMRGKAPLDGLRYCMVVDGVFPQRN